ncbi:hypothetical protein [Microcoleus sp. S13_C3]|uniref:hypothetical protein n=1 Tax=Microcoleus sp. S13_C3 TaxID=3055409 RepID=UPI002FD27CB4
MNRNSSGTSKALFIYQAESASFMQNTAFLLQNFLSAVCLLQILALTLVEAIAPPRQSKYLHLGL